jgi:hypothetical protein
MTQPSKPKSATTKRKVGRPRTLTMPEPIPDTPENVAKAILTTKPKKRHEWPFMQEQHKPSSEQAGSERTSA